MIDDMLAKKFEAGILKKPDAKLIGEEGNIFNLLSIVRVVLRRESMILAWNECWERVQMAKSYEEALAIISEYVNII